MVSLEDVIAVAAPVLRHRIIKTFTAESEGITSRSIIARLIEELNKES
jgi:MoxR-like ATPase